ncbi:aldehyde dehydrogenase [Amphritea opalescens]|uniref:Aldehyde dehydrogenase n=1 Tax=Amphritea opalescens TaxID=2490544 RepID=A0A430KVE0_9GAMM|nr:aldehyde dehydrogenase [Amphritea opalescens]RTE67314.1 aldehyde dehydrogenase [Amphritea opalescens]
MQDLLNKDHAFWKAKSNNVRIETGLYIDGEFHEGSEGHRLETVNPVNGKIIAELAIATKTDVNVAVASAKQAFQSGVWSRIAPRKRMDILFRFADLVEENAADLVVLESLDMGKPVTRIMTADLPEVLSTIRYFAECIDKIDGAVTNTDPSAFHYILREPLGVVAAITPWNFPMMLAMWKVIPALAAGNTVVLKPAEQSPLSCLRLAELFTEAGGPPGVFNVINGPGEVSGKALALHMDVSKICFTGSTEVGRLMMIYGGQSNLKKVSLECGGKSPQIILADVPDLDAAVDAAIAGIYANSGQICSAGSRLLIERPIHAEFVKRFTLKAKTAFVPGDPLDPATTMGPLVSHSHCQNVMGYIEKGKKEGATLLFGGDQPEEFSDGAYLKPTLFDEVTQEMTIAREEIFGPVAVIIPVKDADEAISVANDSIYGLGSSVWTRDLSKAHKMVREIEAGVVWVNCYGDGDATQPFGGYKQSGQGRDRGLDCLLSYTQTKSAWIKL